VPAATEPPQVEKAARDCASTMATRFQTPMGCRFWQKAAAWNQV